MSATAVVANAAGRHELVIASGSGTALSQGLDETRSRRTDQAPLGPGNVFYLGRDPKRKLSVRLRFLRQLPQGHDGALASGPNPATFDCALSFVEHMVLSKPETAILVTMDDDGCAVLELRDRADDTFAEVTFQESGEVELYFRPYSGASSISHGTSRSPEIRSILDRNFGIFFI